MLILPCQLSRGRVRRASASSHATSMRSELGRAKVGSALRHEGLWWCVGEISAKLVATIIYSSPSSLTRQHSSHQNPTREFFTPAIKPIDFILSLKPHTATPVRPPKMGLPLLLATIFATLAFSMPTEGLEQKEVKGCLGGDGRNASPGGDFHV
jgi:hypothetical protein